MLNSSSVARANRRALIERTSLPAVTDSGQGSASPARDDGTDAPQPKQWASASPALHTWLRWYAGQSSYRLEQATEYLEGQLAAGEGFADRDVLQYAYLTRDDGPNLERDAEPFESVDVPCSAPELVGVAEVCKSLKLKRMQLKRLRDRGTFPKPVAELAAGPIWRKDQVESWRFLNQT